MSDLKELARAKWQASGLSSDQASTLKLEPLNAQEIAEKLETEKPQPKAGLLIPYFDPAGNPTEFFRIRYLAPFPGFKGMVSKPQRFAQKANTLNEVYLPPLLERSWTEIFADPGEAIYITEGELKAASGCAHGLATIGLGGVDVWRSTKRGIELLPTLEAVKWENRKVVIVYDSDAATNPNVVKAEHKLAKELLGRGAIVSIATLPAKPDGTKVGLDDYLIDKGVAELKKLLAESPGTPESLALWNLSSEVIYVRNPGIVVVRDTRQIMSPKDFTSHAFANRHYQEIKKLLPDGTPIFVPKPAAKRWIEWEGRAEAHRMTYAPGKDVQFDDHYNLWRGWGCDPEPGDIGPWEWLLDYLFKGEPKAREWFERWCAYPLQYPGTKLYQAIVMWSRHKGVGKTAAAYALMKIYGENGIEIKSKDFKGGFNSWAANRQFVVGDEITGGQARVDADWLKGMITQHAVRINEKHKPEYTIPDCMNYIFTSNHPDALFVEDEDRRYFVHEVVGQPAEREKYEKLDKWLHGSGPSHLFNHLLSLPLGDFNPRERAMDTAAKKMMILHGLSDLAAWVRQLKEDPESMVKLLGENVAKKCDLFTPAQLLKCYDPEGRSRVTTPGMGRELARAGIRQLNGASTIWTRAGNQRLYAVRNADKWVDEQPTIAAKHWEKYFIDGGKF